MSIKTSIILCTYNMRGSLRAALRSGLNQTAQNYEILIVDDGSNDGSWEDLKLFHSKYPRRLTIFRNEKNQGLSFSRNFLIGHSKGEYISILDADDRLIPQKLQRHSALLDSNPKIGVVWGKARVSNVKSSSRVKTLPVNQKQSWDLLTPYEVVHSGTTWRKAALMDAGGYDPDYVLVEGPDMFLKVGDKYLQKFDARISCIKTVNTENSFRAQLRDENRIKYSQKILVNTLKRRHQLFLNEKPVWAV